jgi:hypothetical protein
MEQAKSSNAERAHPENKAHGIANKKKLHGNR